MVSADRQLIMETNRSLRNIKTELENLLEKGVIDEAVFDQIHGSLPQESPLSGPLRTTANAALNNNSSAAAAAASPPTREFNNLSVSNNPTPVQSQSPAPPTYEDTPAPSLPVRNNSAPPGKPIIAHARALYRYNASDARDVTFEKDDKIAVMEYMNADWWMGRNVRTGLEGIFPRNYVLVESENKAPVPPGAQYHQQQPQYGYPEKGGPPQQQNPYNASVPPMAVAEGGQPGQGGEGQGSGKVGEYGKKFGKKLGNATIFGAGATIGSNLVNSIF